MTFSIIVGIILAIVLTILLCVKVLPAKFDGTFSKKPLQFAHNYFNFKKLYLESVLKFLFTLLSMVCIVCGVLIATVGNVFNIIDLFGYFVRYDYFSFSSIIITFFRNLLMGAGVAVVAPIILRLTYEGVLMFILLVKNTIEINNKLGRKETEQE